MSDEVFETLWRAQGLDRVASSIALDQTVTARTLAAPSDAPPARTPSFTAPPLPSISLDLSSPGAVAAGGGLDDPSGPDLLVLDTLGEGGMGRVLLARQRSLARDVAVKVLKPETADADGALSLLREAVVMGGVEHPNIVPVHALGRDDRGHPVLVMKRIEGTSWRALLDDDAHPTWTALLAAHGDRVSAHLEVLMRVADAAHFAHARGVIHRDIKPENVMVGAFGEVYLVDWGIAIRVGRTQPDGDGAFRIRGTPAYMAPEMIGGDPTRLDARTDVYLLGATLHEVLTRTPRHRGVNLHAVLYAAHTSVPVAYGADVPEELAALCNDATHVDPARRPESALAFRRRLADHLRHRASLTLSAVAAERLDALTRALAAAPVDDGLARRLGTESRFGFAQALVVWPDNPRAREGLQRALRTLFDHEVTRENLDAARALAADLDARDEAVDTRLRALEATLDAQRALAAAGQREAWESDLSVGASTRLKLFGLIFLASTGVNVALRFGLSGPDDLTPLHLAFLNVAVLVTLASVLLLARKSLVNRVNRQFAALVMLCVSATLAHRVLATVAVRPPPLAAVVTGDQLILAAICATAAIGLRPWFASLAAWATVGAALTALHPERSLLWFTLTANGMLLLGLYYGWVRARDATPAGEVATPRAPVP